MGRGENSGLGFTGTLTIVFIVLKLAGVIDWTWKWVLCPIWISWLIVGLIYLWIKLNEV